MPSPPPVPEITAPLFIGIVCNWGLLGILCVQTYVYYLGFPNDRLEPKLFAYSVFLFEVAQTALATFYAYGVLITDFGDRKALDNINILWLAIPVMTALVSCAVQSFFAWRIYVLSSRRIPLPLLIVVLSLTQCGFGIYSGVGAHFIGHFSLLQTEGYVRTSIWLGGTALVDILITTSMIFYLVYSRTGFRSTNLLLAKLLRVTVETGFACATFALLELGLFLAYKNTNYHVLPALMLSKLYSNSLLVLLNVRVRIVGGRTVGPVEEDKTLSIVTAPGVSASTAGLSFRRNMVINIDVTHDSDETMQMSTLDVESEPQKGKNTL